MGIFINLIFVVFKMVGVVLKFTGIWLPFIVLMGLIEMEKRSHWSDELQYVLVLIWIWTSMAFVIYTTANNIARLVTKNPQFSIVRALIEKLKNNRYKELRSGFKSDTKPLENKKIDITGFFFGIHKGKYITQKEEQDGHILVVGGAGSGKSSCIAIPTLNTWKNRVFAIDIKGELSRKSKRKAKIFAPGKDYSYGYDPFYKLNRSINRVQESKEIALSLIPITEEVKDPFWKQSAQNLLIACVLHFSNQGYGFIETMIAIQSHPIEELVNIISESLDQNARMFNNQFIGMDNKTLVGIFTELANNIMVFATDEDLKEVLNKEILVTPQDLEKGEDIFIQIDESKIEQWKGLTSLIIAQFLKHFENRAESETNEPILFLLDEFPRLGKIEGITNGLATLRSKKIHIALLIQSLAQLDVIYGKGNRKIIADNAAYTAILKATDTETQEYFSKRVGTHERDKISYNASFDAYTQLGKGTGVSKSTEEKKLIKPEEFAYLKDIVLLTPTGYMRVEKAPYYEDKTIKRQIQDQVVVESFRA